MCGGDKSLIGPMIRAMVCAATLGGEIYNAVDEGNAVVGYAVWMPPGKDLLGTSVLSLPILTPCITTCASTALNKGSSDGTSGLKRSHRKAKTGSQML